jgi:hypothetical protein
MDRLRARWWTLVGNLGRRLTEWADQHTEARTIHEQLEAWVPAAARTRRG